MNFIFLITVVALAAAIPDVEDMTEEDLKNYLQEEYEKEASAFCTKLANAEWDYYVDLTNAEKEETLLTVTLEVAEQEKDDWEHHYKLMNPDNYTESEVKRQVRVLKLIGNAALDQDKLSTLTNAVSQMTNIYSTAKICPYKKQDCDLSKQGLSLDEGIDAILVKSRDYDELVYAWTAWRNASGAKMKELYKTYVELSNEAAQVNGYENEGELWRVSYESENFIEEIDSLWTQIEPLYEELHKYVGNKLKAVYGDKLDISDGLIPAHVFGNMWAQDWRNIAELVKPYPDESPVNVTAALIAQNYTVLKMFETSNEFYKSMGLLPNDICYNTSAGAMIEKPTDGREVVCHASAWDFCDGQNYRIKMCTQVNFEDFTTIHHEMGHIQYYLQYAQQPYNFRTGANPGFHEAIGDTITLSVATPKHLEKIGLVANYTNNEKSSINALMDMALQKVAFLPFGLLIDKWRWDVFGGSVEPDQWNAHWWTYRKKYQKVKPPVDRSDDDFDPGAKFHVAADSQYIAYFVAHIVQFQFYRSLCIAAGEYDPDTKEVPLSQCDFYNSTAAGDKFSAGLKIGASQHWSEVLKVMTGETKLNAAALVEYFEPLHEWLKEQNNGAVFIQPISVVLLALALLLTMVTQ